MDLQTILSKLKKVRRSGSGWIAACPAHDDSKPSLSITQSGDRILLYCHAGCSFEAVAAALGWERPKDMKDGLPTDASRTWIYRDANGAPVLAVCRWDTPNGKRISQFRFESGAWRPKGLQGQRPCYNLPKICSAKADDIVWVVEGEKCVDALERLGVLATTSPGGANAASKADWSWAKDRRVCIIPDNDKPGLKYAQDVAAACLEAGAAEVRIADLTQLFELPEGADVADVMMDLDALQELWEKGKPQQPKASTQKELTITDKDLAHRVVSDSAPIVFSMQQWRMYEDGVWRVAEKQEVWTQILRVIEPVCIAAGIGITAYRLQSVAQILSCMTFKKPEWWSAGRQWLCLSNCALDVETLKTEPHAPEHRCMEKLSYAYDPEARAPLWAKILEENIGDAETIELLQDFAGYCLTRDTNHEIAIWLYGPPGSGKSTVIAGFEAMLGSLAAPLGLWDIERSGFSLSQLIGRHLIIATEQPSEYVRSTHLLNSIISGEAIMLEQKYRDAVSFRPYAKMLWACNELPRVHDVQAGLFRRIRVIHCAKTVSQPDPGIKARLLQEAPGILNWALAGLQRLRQRGRFTQPQRIREALEEYQLSCDIPRLFLEECTEQSEFGLLSASELYAAYARWCEENGHRPKSSTAVANDWVRLGLVRTRGRRGTYYAGRKLKRESDPGSEPSD